MALLNHLKKYRSELGVNQTELGKLTGVSRQTISLIERGDYSPSVTLALKIAKICKVKVEDIFVYVEDNENDKGQES
ncbi:MAG: helix-turn-helix transcriptional regulator [Dorea sp.]|nr:helix-turn-helix transcriptional regulator [Dorea sp.]